MDKVKNFCDHSMTLREMTDNLLTTGHFWTTPASFRVNCQELFIHFIYLFSFGHGKYELQKKIAVCDHPFYPFIGKMNALNRPIYIDFEVDSRHKLEIQLWHKFPFFHRFKHRLWTHKG